MRVVMDMGIFVSALIRKQGTTGVVLRALRDGRFTAIYTTGIVVEIIDVLGWAKFRAKYHIEPDDITALVNLIRLRGELVTPTQKVTVCRDPKDDKFLEAALAAQTDCIVSGDADLLVLNPFEEIPILRPAEFFGRIMKSFIDAVNEVTRERAQSYLKPEHQERVADAYHAFKDVEGFAKGSIR
jgi:putative PIN family toxin of toxin-antitoxin system